MNNFPVALQLYSVRNEMANDFYGTLKQVKEMGYDGVEFAGLFGKSAEEIKDYCDKLNLVPVSAHVPFVDMMNDMNIIHTYAQIGCKYIVIPYLTSEYRPGNDKFNCVIEGAKKLGEKANSLGMKLAYHNHDFEFVKIDGEYAIDILYKEVPANLLQSEFDTCWVSVGGENPADYIRKYSGRAEIVHLKDYSGSKSDNMYSLIGIDDDKKKESTKKFEYRPLGKGVQDFPAILSAAKQAGTLWIIVEQDKPTMELSPLECAKISIDYLNSL